MRPSDKQVKEDILAVLGQQPCTIKEVVVLVVRRRQNSSELTVESWKSCADLYFLVKYGIWALHDLGLIQEDRHGLFFKEKK